VKRPRIRHDRRVLLLALIAGLPGSVAALLWIWTGELDTTARVTLGLLLVGVWVGAAFVARSTVVRPLQTLANLLNALKHEDYSIDARGADRDDPLGLVLHEANTLRALLRERRLGAIEATTLLRTVMEEIDVAIFAFDQDDRLRLINRAGEQLLRRPSARAMGSQAHDLGLAFCLDGDAPRTVERVFPGAAGRWELRRGGFRQGGVTHRLVVLANLSRALREEERQAWQRLIRVLSHEINNSLTPIGSIAETLQGLHDRKPPPPDRDNDVRDGLAIIARRAGALSRFMTSYARLAHLPAPRTQPLEVRPWIERVARLETRRDIALRGGPDITIEADEDQLDQVLINLLQNAVDAAAETGGGVEVGWDARDGKVEIWVADEGPGLASTANLFVPFFTTKPHGSGIGLALSRQIVEAHAGTLILENRSDGPGCRASLRLPVERVGRGD
jgi:two-component system, NtrC family, nitrogen regulation sensor histidine kinase NtrY